MRSGANTQVYIQSWKIYIHIYIYIYICCVRLHSIKGLVTFVSIYSVSRQDMTVPTHNPNNDHPPSILTRHHSPYTQPQQWPPTVCSDETSQSLHTTPTMSTHRLFWQDITVPTHNPNNDHPPSVLTRHHSPYTQPQQWPPTVCSDETWQCLHTTPTMSTHRLFWRDIAVPTHNPNNKHPPSVLTRHHSPYTQPQQWPPTVCSDETWQCLHTTPTMSTHRLFWRDIAVPTHNPNNEHPPSVLTRHHSPYTQPQQWPPTVCSDKTSQSLHTTPTMSTHRLFWRDITVPTHNPNNEHPPSVLTRHHSPYTQPQQWPPTVCSDKTSQSLHTTPTMSTHRLFWRDITVPTHNPNNDHPPSVLTRHDSAYTQPQQWAPTVCSDETSQSLHTTPTMSTHRLFWRDITVPTHNPNNDHPPSVLTRHHSPYTQPQQWAPTVCSDETSQSLHTTPTMSTHRLFWQDITVPTHNPNNEHPPSVLTRHHSPYTQPQQWAPTVCSDKTWQSLHTTPTMSTHRLFWQVDAH